MRKTLIVLAALMAVCAAGNTVMAHGNHHRRTTCDYVCPQHEHCVRECPSECLSEFCAERRETREKRQTENRMSRAGRCHAGRGSRCSM